MEIKRRWRMKTRLKVPKIFFVCHKNKKKNQIDLGFDLTCNIDIGRCLGREIG